MRKFTLSLGIGLFIAIASLLNAADEEAINKTLRDSEGTWKIVSREAFGQVLTEDEVKGVQLVTKGNQWTLYYNQEVRARGTRQVVSVDKGVRKTVIETEGGRTFKNIAKVTGDKLIICRAREGDDFPKSFTSENGILTVYQRVSNNE